MGQESKELQQDATEWQALEWKSGESLNLSNVYSLALFGSFRRLDIAIPKGSLTDSLVLNGEAKTVEVIQRTRPDRMGKLELQIIGDDNLSLDKQGVIVITLSPDVTQHPSLAIHKATVKEASFQSGIPDLPITDSTLWTTKIIK